jgi:ketosteroid isomerase-like protein
MPGKSGLSGPYQGKEAILELFAYLAQLTNGTLRFTASRVLSERAPVMVVYGRKTATRDDRQLDTDAMHIFSLRDRVVREMWTFHEDQGSMDEFWTA